MDKWEFLQRHDGAWYWRHSSTSGAVRTSAACFECELDCVGNAIYHGFLPRPAMSARAPIPLTA